MYTYKYVWIKQWSLGDNEINHVKSTDVRYWSHLYYRPFMSVYWANYIKLVRSTDVRDSILLYHRQLKWIRWVKPKPISCQEPISNTLARCDIRAIISNVLSRQLIMRMPYANEFKLKVLFNFIWLSIYYLLFCHVTNVNLRAVICQMASLALTHWGRVTHICIGNVTIIGSDNGLSPDRRQAIIWINAGILCIGPLGTNFSEILTEILKVSFKKMLFKV